MRAFLLEEATAFFAIAWWTRRCFVAVDGALVVYVPKIEELEQPSSQQSKIERPSWSLSTSIITYTG